MDDQRFTELERELSAQNAAWFETMRSIESFGEVCLAVPDAFQKDLESLCDGGAMVHRGVNGLRV